MSRVLAATDENKMTSIATHFKKLTTRNNMFILSYYLKQLWHPAAFTSHVQCVRLAAGRRTLNFLKCVVIQVILFSTVAVKRLTFHKVVQLEV